jgi:RNA polymerase sigma factor (sigma-70 family)
MNFELNSDMADEDALLWLGMRNGDMVAFDRLIKKYSRPLFNFVSRFCQDRDLLKDCIQELFLELWNKRSSITQPVSVKWYLFKAVRNRVFREQTKWRRNEQLDDDYSFVLEFSIETKMIDHADDAELTKKIKKILETLPARQREIVYLRYYENLSYDEIAMIMNVNKQSVHNGLQKAYKNIRSEWGALLILLSMCC